MFVPARNSSTLVPPVNWIAFAGAKYWPPTIVPLLMMVRLPPTTADAVGARVEYIPGFAAIAASDVAGVDEGATGREQHAHAAVAAVSPRSGRKHCRPSSATIAA